MKATLSVARILRRGRGRLASAEGRRHQRKVRCRPPSRSVAGPCSPTLSSPSGAWLSSWPGPSPSRPHRPRMGSGPPRRSEPRRNVRSRSSTVPSSPPGASPRARNAAPRAADTGTPIGTIEIAVMEPASPTAPSVPERSASMVRSGGGGRARASCRCRTSATRLPRRHHGRKCRMPTRNRSSRHRRSCRSRTPRRRRHPPTSPPRCPPHRSPRPRLPRRASPMAVARPSHRNRRSRRPRPRSRPIPTSPPRRGRRTRTCSTTPPHGACVARFRSRVPARVTAAARPPGSAARAVRSPGGTRADAAAAAVTPRREGRGVGTARGGSRTRTPFGTGT